MATKQKKKRKGIFRSFIIKALLTVFLAYVAVSFVQIQIQINDKKEQLAILEQKIAEQEAKNAELSELLENGIDEDYIAKIAREYGFAMPDEKVYENIKNS